MYNYLSDITPYKQITKLNNKNNCRLEYKTVDIKSLFFWFDQLNNVIPTQLTIIKGQQIVKYTGIYVIEITDNKELDNTYGYDNCLVLHYTNDKVKKFKNLLKYGETYKSLVGYHIIDWSHNTKLIKKLKKYESEYIELNYYISKQS